MKPKGGGSSEKPHSEIGRVIEPQSEENRTAPPTTGAAPSQRETRPQHQQRQEIAEQRHAHPQQQHPKIASQHPSTVGGIGDDSHKAKAAISPPQHESSKSETTAHPRQVIAVSASKGPAAFFNLARKFLVTDKECDLSALEGAIVSAVDAAHLLERSKLAQIIRVQTSYVTVEPKRKSHQSAEASATSTAAIAPEGRLKSSTGTDTKFTAASQPTPTTIPTPETKITTTKSGRRKGGSLRRARIIITVRRTEDYEKWLVENPHTSGGLDDDDDHELSPPRIKSQHQKKP